MVKVISDVQNLINNRPTTLGMTKTISTSLFIGHSNKIKQVLNEDSLLNKDNIAKRKFDTINKNSQGISSSLSESESDFCGDTNEENNGKRFCSESKPDIDNLLKEYESNNCEEPIQDNKEGLFDQLSPSKDKQSHIGDKAALIKSENILFSVQSPILTKKSSLDMFKNTSSNKK